MHFDGAMHCPELRLEVIGALQALSDPEHQRMRWGRVEEGVGFFDDLTLNVHILYDDCAVLPDPQSAVPELLHPAEVQPLLELHTAFWPMLQELGERPDIDYLSDPRWPIVVRAAAAALVVFESSDRAAFTDKRQVEPMQRGRLLLLEYVIGLDGDLDANLAALAACGPARPGFAVQVDRSRLRAALDAFERGAISADQLERWAELAHGADDVTLDPGDEEYLATALFELSAPQLFGSMDEIVADLRRREEGAGP